MIDRDKPENAENQESVRFRGVAVSPGLAAGEARLYQDIFDHDYSSAPHEGEARGDELTRLQIAIGKVLEDLSNSADQVKADAGGDACEIFHAHELILSDPGLKRELESMLENESASAEMVVQTVFRKREERFLSLKNPMFRQRADDVADIARRILRELAGFKDHSLENFPAGAVLVATQLYASEMVYLARRHAEAIATEIGSPGSHVAVLAQAMGIPAVTQLKGLVKAVSNGDRLLVDGLRGVVVLKPDTETDTAFRDGQKRFRLRIAGARKRSSEPARTPAGIEIPVMANVNVQGDADKAARNGADGIGLYRLEGLYFERGSLPDEDELVSEIRSNIAPFAGGFVCLRLLDIGGDKNLPYLDLPVEKNPFLGRRGVRLLFDHPQLLRTQIRAFLRLSRDHKVRFLVPMITTSEEMKEIRAMFEAEACQLGIEELPPLGAMVETPAAALCAGDIVQHADFLSIGTNDLTQYVMAADRESPLVARYFRDDHPAVLRLIRMIAAEAGGKLVAVCGRLAGKEEAIPMLIDAGVRLLSVAAPLIPIIKEAVRNEGAGSAG